MNTAAVVALLLAAGVTSDIMSASARLSPARASGAGTVMPASGSVAWPASQRRCNSAISPRVYASFNGFFEGMHVAVFSAGASLDAKPLCVITDNSDFIGGLALDPSGDLWIMNEDVPAITVFEHGADRAAAPKQRIEGPATLLTPVDSSPRKGIAIDSSGDAWVVNYQTRSHVASYLTEYANSATGDAVPIGSIGYGDGGVSEGLVGPVGVAIDNGGDLWVCNSTIPGQVLEFSPPFTDTSTPVARWSLPESNEALYIAASSQGRIFVMGEGDSGDTVFAYKRRGDTGQLQASLAAPREAIYGIATDEKGRLYVSGARNGYSGTIDVLEPEAKAYVPIRTITSSALRGDPPLSITVGP